MTEVVELEPGFGFLPFDAYQRRVAELTCGVLLYQRDKSRLIASGAVFDAFFFAKPCIAYRTPVFEELFQDMGDIGYLCDSYEEMRNLVSKLVENPPADRYARQRANILQGRGMFEPSALAGSLRSILDFGRDR